MLRATRALALALALFGASGCVSARVRAAREQSNEAFKATLTASASQPFSRREAHRMAAARAALAWRDVAEPEVDAWVSGLESCAELLHAVLRERAEKADAVGAKAARLLVASKGASSLEFAEAIRREEPAWRAVGARSMTLASDDEPAVTCDVGWNECEARGGSKSARASAWRRRSFVDGSAEVRLAALEAANDAADPRDVPELLAVAAHDPDPMARRLAIRALGATNSIDAVLGLRELWARATAEEREAIALAQAVTLRFSGLGSCDGAAETASCVAFRVLWRAVEAEAGKPSVLAALALLDVFGHDPTSANRFASAAGIAQGVLERAIDGAEVETRVLAIEGAPLGDASLLEATVDASHADEPRVAVAALSRLAEDDTPVSKDERTAARAALRTFAVAGRGGGSDALVALAKLGESGLFELLRREAKSTNRGPRASAAEAFVATGSYAEALALTTDADAIVRARAVCAVLTDGAVK